MPRTFTKRMSAPAPGSKTPKHRDLLVESERIDELPIILEYAKRMGISDAIDRVLSMPHGNRTGLSYGQLGLGLIAAIATRREHRLRPVELWSKEHRPTLEAAVGGPVGDKDFTDDRLADLLWELGDPEGAVREAIEEQVGQGIVTGYRLPTKVGRADTTSVSVYHDREGKEGLLVKGKSKDHRPDLRQFVEGLGTLDPAGIPLVTSTLPGNQADDKTYWPIWKRMTRIIKSPKWLFVGDSKLHSAENLSRIKRAGGWFLTPIPMKGNVPKEFERWLREAPKPEKLTKIRLEDSKGKRRVVGYGFETARKVQWTDPDTKEEVKFPERVFVVLRTSFKKKQIHVLKQRLVRAEEALKAKDGQRAEDRTEFEAELQGILDQHKVADYLSFKVAWKIEKEKKWAGPGRPGPNRRKRVIRHDRARVVVSRHAKAIKDFERQAGWRAYGSNALRSRLSLHQAAVQYAGQWQPERGFHRIKGMTLTVAPIYLRTDRHIRGLMLIVNMVLRLITLIEFVARRNLAAKKESISGVYQGAPKITTARPTAELMMKAFEGVTLHRIRIGNQIHRQVSGLTAAHKRILKFIEVPESVYAALETG